MKNILKHFKTIFLCTTCIVILSVSARPFLSYALTTEEEYNANNEELARLREEQGQLNSQLAEVNDQMNAIGNRIAAIDQEISEKQLAIDALQVEIDALNLQIDEQYEAMKLRIQYMYEHHHADTIELLLSSHSLSEMLLRTEYVIQISDYDRNMLAQLNNLCAMQTANQTQLDNDMTQLTALRAETESESANLAVLLASVQSQIDTYSTNISEAEALSLAYEERLEAERLAREQEAIRQQQAANNHINTTPVSYDATDLAMLAAIIECEAGNQPYEGLLAVGSVVLNRVNDSRFANTITGVIYAPYQFSPVASGRFAIVLARGATDRCVQAAQEVLNGNININALYFHAYNPSRDTGGTVIGDHVFY